MQIHKLENTQGITGVEIYPSVCCLCPIGGDWYNMKITITMEVGKYYPDYCDIRAFLNEEVQGRALLIEDVLKKVKDFIKMYEPVSLTITGNVPEIETHPPVKVYI